MDLSLLVQGAQPKWLLSGARKTSLGSSEHQLPFGYSFMQHLQQTEVFSAGLVCRGCDCHLHRGPRKTLLGVVTPAALLPGAANAGATVWQGSPIHPHPHPSLRALSLSSPCLGLAVVGIGAACEPPSALVRQGSTSGEFLCLLLILFFFLIKHTSKGCTPPSIYSITGRDTNRGGKLLKVLVDLKYPFCFSFY